MTFSEAGRKGAAVTNSRYSKEQLTAWGRKGGQYGFLGGRRKDPDINEVKRQVALREQNLREEIVSRDFNVTDWRELQKMHRAGSDPITPCPS